MKLLLCIAPLLVLSGCDRAPRTPAAGTVPAPGAVLFVPTTTVAQITLPTPVFDLREVALDYAALQARAIEVNELTILRILRFPSKDATLSLPVSTLPTGAAARTILLLVNVEVPTHAAMLLYGAPGRNGEACAFEMNAGYYPSFWGYAADVADTHAMPSNTWTCLVAAYDGATMTLYVDERKAGSKNLTLNTPMTALQMGSFVGSIAAATVWDRAFTPDEVTRAITQARTQLR